MENIVQQSPVDNIDGCSMRAVLAVHREDCNEAKTFIEQITNGNISF